MAVFVRKNIVTFSFVFTATDGTPTQPSGARVSLDYKDLGGAVHSEAVDLTYSSDTNAWTGTWDSSASGDGPVHWMVYGFGTLQAAAQGEFAVSANEANTL